MDEPTFGSASAGGTAEPVPAAPAYTEPGEKSLSGVPELAPAAGAGYLEPPAKKRTAWLIGGVGLLVIVLAAAAYVGGRWLNRAPAAAAAAPGKGQMRVMTNNGGVSRTFQVEPAKELPQSSPDLMGVLVRRQDNSLFLGTGKIQQHAQAGASGSQLSAPTYDGPVLEAVVTHDTMIYRDETNFDAPPPADQAGKIQQVVKPDSMDDIPVNSVVQVWGAKTGDRFVARVLVYEAG